MTQAAEPIEQTVDFLAHFKDLEDPRQAGKILYLLDEVLLLCLVAPDLIRGCRSRELGGDRRVRQAEPRI